MVAGLGVEVFDAVGEEDPWDMSARRKSHGESRVDVKGILEDVAVKVSENGHFRSGNNSKAVGISQA